ncbi:hypothetical protein JK361_02540 [Streptomyces sp. 5-8]|uniref:Integral membrane protein n=1 Tax=Streptomyces musisoli TaxID=2802280 RepID=A0ABS1NTQ7_9ACTN|nr:MULTISPECIES: hypothetical protein [Streptomyces]MBL1103491.1 hypothetical protein [Streptomyces musisoli]MBY8839903.1 hypothetical protein [Streptomyces sp. SP2-10]
MADGGARADEPAERATIQELRARIAALESQRARPPRHHVRSFVAAVLIVVGCLLAPLSVVAAWAADELGDTDRYVATVAPLASNPDVQNAVANRATDALMSHIDLPALLADVAPQDRPRLQQALGGRLGDALENAVRSFVHDQARKIAASDAFKTVWTDANRDIHSALDKAITGSGGGAVQLHNDSVTLDLAPVLDRLKQRLVDAGIGAAAHIPEVHTDLTLVRSDQIGKIKTYVRILQIAGNWLPVLAVVLVAAGVLLSVRRRRALVAGCLGVAVTTGILGIGLRIFRVLYLDRLPAGVSPGAAGAVYDALTHFLQTTVRMVVALGVIIALAAWLSGPGRHAGLVRRLWTSGIGAVRATADRGGLRTGPVGPFVRRYRTWITWILVVAALLVYLLWSYPTGWVVVGIALCLLFLLAVVEFLAAAPSDAEKGAKAPA